LVLTEIGVGREAPTRLAAAEAEDEGIAFNNLEAVLDFSLSFSLSLSFSAATLDAEVTITGLTLTRFQDDDAEVVEVADVEGDIPGEEVTDDDRDEALL